MLDSELKERFTELRDSVAATTPPFEMPVLRARPRTWRNDLLKYAAVLTLLAGVGVAGVTVRARLQQARMQREYANATILHWRASTDVLLQIPGRELTSSVPSLTQSVIP